MKILLSLLILNVFLALYCLKSIHKKLDNISTRIFSFLFPRIEQIFLRDKFQIQCDFTECEHARLDDHRHSIRVINDTEERLNCSSSCLRIWPIAFRIWSIFIEKISNLLHKIWAVGLSLPQQMRFREMRAAQFVWSVRLDVPWTRRHILLFFQTTLDHSYRNNRGISHKCYQNSANVRPFYLGTSSFSFVIKCTK